MKSSHISFPFDRHCLVALKSLAPDVPEHGYWHARRLEFLTSGTFHMLEWARIGADTVFLVFGVVPIVVATLLVTLSRSTAAANPTVVTGT